MPFQEHGWGRVLPGKEIPRDSDFEEQASKLNLGLKSCHAVVSSYRSLLSNDRTDEDLPDEERDPDLGAKT
jgi:hypothetical protein